MRHLLAALLLLPTAAAAQTDGSATAAVASRAASRTGWRFTGTWRSP
jgi:hypothetical protein